MTLRRGLLWIMIVAAPSAVGAPDQTAELIKATRAALAKKAFDEAADSCRRAARSVRGQDALDEARVLELCGDVEVRRERHLDAANRYAEAARAARANLKLRKKLLFQRKREATKAKAEKSAQLANDVLEADRTLEQVMRRPRRSGDALEKTLAALADAAQIYRRDRDRDRADEALALRALVLVQSEKAEDGLRAADKSVERASSSKWAAAMAQEARVWALLERGDTQSAARAAILFNQLKSPGARSALLDRACHRLDGEKGDGSCARLELQMTGDVTFTDFSSGRRKAELGDADIERVHAQALPALEACVLRAAKKDPEFFRNVEIQLSWAVDGEGRAIDVDLTPKRNKPDIMPCASALLAKLRYPRVYSKERKNVMVPYHLD